MTDFAALQIVAVGVGSFALGCYLGHAWRWQRPKTQGKELVMEDGAVNLSDMLLAGMGESDGQDAVAMNNTDTLALLDGDFKLVLVVRMDLKMGKGKIAAQCSHATLGIYKKILKKAPTALKRWEMYGQRKVVLKIDDEESMLELSKKARAAGVPTHITIDAGKTQVAPDSLTVMAVGPAPDHVLDAITGHLKLL